MSAEIKNNTMKMKFDANLHWDCCWNSEQFAQSMDQMFTFRISYFVFHSMSNSIEIE